VWYNASFHASTQLKLSMEERLPKTTLNLNAIRPNLRVEAVDHEWVDRDEAFNQLKQNLVRRIQMKQSAG
jgi:hypothetical protein